MVRITYETIKRKWICRSKDDVNADVIQDPTLHEEMMVTTQNMNDFICDEDEEDETIENYCSDETNELQSEDDSDLDHDISS
ncbi:hypothetical protein ACOSQ4_030067 [Xanthoceras sorbifolium]